MKNMHVIVNINHMKLLKASLESYTYKRSFCKTSSNAFVDDISDIFISDIDDISVGAKLYTRYQIPGDISQYGTKNRT